MFSNEEDQRFNVVLEVYAAERGDMGSIVIGGLHYDLREALSVANQVKMDIERHVDGIQGVHPRIEDVYGEYKDVPAWWAEKRRNKSWEEIKEELPVEDRYSEGDVQQLLQNILKQTQGVLSEDLQEEIQDVIDKGITS